MRQRRSRSARAQRRASVTRWTAVAVASLIALAGCGGDGDDSALTALTDAVLADDGLTGFEVLFDEARCTARTIVDDAGTEAAQSIVDDYSGFDDLDADAADAIVTARDACIRDRVENELTVALSDDGDGDLTRFRIDADAAGCVADELTTSIDAGRLVQAFLAGEDSDIASLDDEEVSLLATAIADCVPNIDGTVQRTFAESIVGDAVDFTVTAPEATCVAGEVVDELGAPALIELGLRSGGEPVLPDESADAFTSAYLACVDFRRLLLDGIAETGVPDDVLACIGDELDDADIEALVRLGVSGSDVDEGVADIIADATDACI